MRRRDYISMAVAGPNDGGTKDPVGYYVDQDAGEMYLYGVVGEEITAEQVVRDVKQFGRKKITVHINSPGGSVWQGTAVYNALRAHKGKVDVVVDGVAASAASMITQAGQKRTIRQGAFLMVHRATVLVMGNAKTLDRALMYMRKVDGQIADIYAKRSGRSVAQVEQWMDDETWFTGEDAVKAGLADETEEVEPAPTDHMDLSMFTAVPEALGGNRHGEESDEQWSRRVAAFLGFDGDNTRFEFTNTLADPPPAPKSKETDMDFTAWLKSKGFDPDAVTDDQKASLKALYEAEQAAGEAPTDPPKDGDGDPAAQATTAERERVSVIRDLCNGEHSEIEAKAIDEGWTREATAEAVLKADREARPKAPAVLSKKRVAEETVEALTVAVQMAAGEDESALESEYDERVMDRADRHFRRMRLRDLISTCCRMDGQQVPSIGADPGEWAQAAFSTTRLPGILGDSARKSMERAYRAFPSAAGRLARVLSASDFKQHTGYRLTGAFDLDEVGPDGELKHVTVGEDSFPFQVTTRGAMFGLTRQMIINDDMGALLAIPQKFGRGAARTKEEMFWTLVLANTGSYFAAGNKNYKNGASTALGPAGLELGEQVLAEQVDKDGKPILVMGRYLVVPPALSGAARRLYTSDRLITGEDATKADSNIHQSKYEPVVVPYLGNTNFHASASSKSWYLWGDPADVALFGIAYLKGRQGPVIEEVGVQPNILGQAWRGYIDVGVCQVDYRGGTKMKGEA